MCSGCRFPHPQNRAAHFWTIQTAHDASCVVSEIDLPAQWLSVRINLPIVLMPETLRPDSIQRIVPSPHVGSGAGAKRSKIRVLDPAVGPSWKADWPWREAVENTLAPKKQLRSQRPDLQE
jgi:hypothetical protein